MQYFLLIGVIVLAVESKAEGNGTSATVAAATTNAVATTGAPSSYGASIFARLIEEFDVLKAKDKSLSAKVRALNSKVATLTSKDEALTSKDEALTSKVAALTSKDSALTARVKKLEKFDERTKGRNYLRLNSHRLEVFHDGEWGTVCDDSFDYNDARVACRTMGKTGGSKYASNWNYNSAGTGKIWLDHMKCTGSESSFFDCPHEPWGYGSYGCGHHEDVYMTCSSSGM